MPNASDWLTLDAPATWFVTGGAGFIGSHLAESLLRAGQTVTVYDNLLTGYQHNLDAVREAVGEDAAARLTFVEGDIRDLDATKAACEGAQYVLHQAALGSVPWSVRDPALCNKINVTGFLHVLEAAKAASVRRVVYASSAAVYGDDPADVKTEDQIGDPTSPYATSKQADELYARTFQDHYGLECVGLRYFNVFGRRQDPEGAYAAVIPKWIGELLGGETPQVYGDGGQTRDFCHVSNVVQANLRAATAPSEATNTVYNVANGGKMTLLELYAAIRSALESELGRDLPELAPGPVREGDIRHSLASIDKAREALGYEPGMDVPTGLAEAIAWYVAQT